MSGATLSMITMQPDAQGSAKYLFRMADGSSVEGVRFAAPSGVNLCLSSQVGCAYRCTHCATGLLRFARNLSAEEMVAQAEQMAEGAPFDPLFLGQGEPFLNLTEVLAAIDVMVNRSMIASPCNALVGTSGIPRGWSDLAAREERPHLSVSVHGVPDAVRVRIVPHGRRYGLDALQRDLLGYQDRTGDDVTLNYTPVASVNDSDENFADFARFARRFACTARLIPYNAIAALPHERSSPERLDRFFEILTDHGVNYVYRPSAAQAVLGGCGQLGLLGSDHGKPIGLAPRPRAASVRRVTTAGIGLGTWGLGGRAYGSVSSARARLVLDTALDEGIRVFDTADIYGEGRVEALLGRAVGGRPNVMIISKVGYTSEAGGEQDFGPVHLRRAAAAIVQRLGRPPDVLLLHSAPRAVLADGHAFEHAEQLAAEGLAGTVGVSVRSHDDVELALAWPACSVVEVLMNILDQRAIDTGAIERAHARGVRVVARVPLCAGHLTDRPPHPASLAGSDHRLRWPLEQHARWARGAERCRFLAGDRRTLAQAAIAFCAQTPGVTWVVPGATRPLHARQNAAATRGEARLTAEELAGARDLAGWVSEHVVPLALP